jgi:hypothetical protein
VFSRRGDRLGDWLSEVCICWGDEERRQSPGFPGFLLTGVSILLCSSDPARPLSAEVPALDWSEDPSNEDDAPALFAGEFSALVGLRRHGAEKVRRRGVVLRRIR